MLAERHGFRKRIQGLKARQREGKSYHQGLLRLCQELQHSRELASRRAATLPQPEFPSELPISEKWQEIATLIQQHQVIILCGETGSGKSTQLPKICLTQKRGIFGRIGHTQPRRIAARSLAARISEELGCELGTGVGFKVRFHDHVRPESHIKLMTDGMLLAEVQQDRFLNEYDTLIIDEAHERSLNIDFLLGYLRQLLPKRPDLKLIITSATIDPERFAEHFAGAPIINVSGRTYPVELRYRPPGQEGFEVKGQQPSPVAEESGEICSERDEPMQHAILEAVDELSRIDRGDILIFLSGEREIRETAESLRKHKLQRTEVLPLYARLGTAEQARIFHPSGERRIILATNVAETSLTVPGIRYVIDAGFARISRYSYRSKVQRLPIERISQASADQRKGRCGRVAAGVCIRLYSEDDYNSRRQFTEPEILRTNLASVILQMKILGFGEIADFPFVDSPDSRLIKDGYRVLEEIGAVGGDRKVTRLGRILGKLPVDPRIGRILLEAAHTHCLKEILVIAAAMSIQDPRERPVERQQAADEAHHHFRHEESDFLGFLKLWDHLEERRRHLSKRKFRNYCRDNFLSWIRVQEWHDIHHQLRGQMHELGYKENSMEAGYEAIHKAILSGLLSHLGFKDRGGERDYQGARNSRFHIFPGSGLFQKQPKWVVAAELVETTRLYARTAAAVRPEWVESLAGHLLKRSYSEPHWERNRGQVAAYEKVTLFGLTLVPRRKINYGPINPREAREIFIRFALVEGDFHTRAPFWRHNRELMEQIQGWEHKIRRQDLLVDHQVIYDYYDRLVPEGVYSTPQFDKWLREITRTEPKILHMRLQDLTRQGAVEASAEQFPDQFDLNGMQLPLEYRFEPGHPADGVTLKVPQAVLNQVSEERCQWLVPGLLPDLIVALLRSLPKQLRKSFVPAPDYARACLKVLHPSEKPLTLALSEQLKIMTGVHIPEDAWREESIPEHLRMNFQVLDERSGPVDSGRDLPALQRRHGGKEKTAYRQLPAAHLEREGIRGWDFGELPETVEMDRGGIKLRGFPALVDRGDSVALQVLDSQANAAREGRSGLRRLFMLQLSQDVRFLRRNLDGLERMCLQYAKAAPTPQGWGPPAGDDLENDLIALILDLTFIEGMPGIRDEQQFLRRIQERKGSLVGMANEVSALVGEILDRYQQVRKVLAGVTQINWMASIADIRQQLDRLVFIGFLRHTPYQQLRHLPRYLKAIALRLEKLSNAAVRDRARMREMEALFQKWLEREERYRNRGRRDERIEEMRWAIEELRVSLFAQELKTAYPVSLKRLEQRWRELGL